MKEIKRAVLGLSILGFLFVSMTIPQIVSASSNATAGKNMKVLSIVEPIIIQKKEIMRDSISGSYWMVLSAKKDSDKIIKAKYKMKKDKVEFKDEKGNVRGLIYFQYPQFTGTSSSIKKINKQIKKESSNFLKSENAKSIEKFTKLAIKNNMFYNNDEQYYWITSCKVTYNKNNIVSFHMTEEWYAGGVCNVFEYGFNYNLKTGHRLSIDEVVAKNAKKEILKAAKEYCGTDKNAYNIIKNTKNYKFYFSKGKVFICYGSYELEHGNSIDNFSVTGKYK